MKISKKVIFATASFVILVLQAFGVKVDVPVVNEIVAAGAGILVMLGIISDTHTSGIGGEEKNENREDSEQAAPTTEIPSEKDGEAADENAEETDPDCGENPSDGKLR